MSTLKYEPLRRALSKSDGKCVTLTFSEIEQIIGASLPASASKDNRWWNPSGRHIHAQTWEKSGYRAVHVEKNRVLNQMEFSRS
jgi:hypothetical protein